MVYQKGNSCNLFLGGGDAYSNESYYWLGGRGTGSVFQWVRSGEDLPSSNPYWREGDPGIMTGTGSCLVMQTDDANFKTYPGQPYEYGGCTVALSVLCERKY